MTSTTYWLGTRGDEQTGDRPLTDAPFLEQARDTLDFIGLDYYYRLDTPEDTASLVASDHEKIYLDPAGL